MSATSAIAQAIVSAVAPLVEQYETLTAFLRENDAKSETVKIADLNAAIEKSDDAAVVKARAEIAKQHDAIAAAQAKIREARKSAQTVLFPGTVVTDTLDPEERKAKIAEAAGIRKTIVETYKSALAVDPEFTLPELSPVVGQRGRKAGFVSSAAGKPKPRVSAISLDGKPVEPKATFGNLQKAVKATTNVSVDNDILIGAFLTALGTTDWQSDSVKGKTVEFTHVVDSESGRTVTVSVTV